MATSNERGTAESDEHPSSSPSTLTENRVRGQVITSTLRRRVASQRPRRRGGGMLVNLPVAPPAESNVSPPRSSSEDARPPSGRNLNSVDNANRRAVTEPPLYSTPAGPSANPTPNTTSSSEGEDHTDLQRTKHHMGDGMYSLCETLGFAHVQFVEPPRIYYHEFDEETKEREGRGAEVKEPLLVRAVEMPPVPASMEDYGHTSAFASTSAYGPAFATVAGAAFPTSASTPIAPWTRRAEEWRRRVLSRDDGRSTQTSPSRHMDRDIKSYVPPHRRASTTSSRRPFPPTISRNRREWLSHASVPPPPRACHDSTYSNDLPPPNFEPFYRGDRRERQMREFEQQQFHLLMIQQQQQLYHNEYDARQQQYQHNSRYDTPPHLYPYNIYHPQSWRAAPITPLPSTERGWRRGWRSQSSALPRADRRRNRGDRTFPYPIDESDPLEDGEEDEEEEEEEDTAEVWREDVSLLRKGIMNRTNEPWT